ncbi:MAG: hypothetical protein M1115_10605 [Actinobacteria bacterium]|nr:hypothetical protein [Actinomycetota bacterium]
MSFFSWRFSLSVFPDFLEAVFLGDLSAMSCLPLSLPGGYCIAGSFARGTPSQAISELSGFGRDNI